MTTTNIAELVLQHKNCWEFIPDIMCPKEFMNRAGDLIPILNVYDHVAYGIYKQSFESNKSIDSFNYPIPELVLDLPEGDLFYIRREIIKKAKRADFKLELVGSFVESSSDGRKGNIPFDKIYSEEKSIELLKQFLRELLII